MGMGPQLIDDAEMPFRPFFANAEEERTFNESLGRGRRQPNARTHVMINALLP